MRSRRAAHGAGGGGGHDGGGTGRWLISYADLITLLMVFFVVLYAMAKVDAEKYAEVARSLRRSFGGSSGLTALPLPGSAAPGPPVPLVESYPAGAPQALDDWLASFASEERPGGVIAPPEPAEPPRPPEPVKPVSAEPPPPAPAPRPAELPKPPPKPLPKPPENSPEARLSGAAAALQKLPGPPGALAVQLTEQGLVIEILVSVLFPAGEAVLLPQAAAVLDPVAAALRDLPYSIMVHGAGEDGPGGTANWSLAAQRSVSVIEHLVNTGRVPADRLVAIGYGGRSGGGKVSVVVVRPA